MRRSRMCVTRGACNSRHSNLHIEKSSASLSSERQPQVPPLPTSNLVCAVRVGLVAQQLPHHRCVAIPRGMIERRESVLPHTTVHPSSSSLCGRCGNQLVYHHPLTVILQPSFLQMLRIQKKASCAYAHRTRHWSTRVMDQVDRKGSGAGRPRTRSPLRRGPPEAAEAHPRCHSALPLTQQRTPTVPKQSNKKCP